MKLKRNHLSRKKLRLRTRISVTVLLLFAFLSAWGFWHIQKGNSLDGTPVVLRKSFMWNEKVWKILSSSKRMAKATTTVPPGKSARLNGDIGLEEKPDFSHYSVQVVNGTKHFTLPLSAFKALPKTSSTTEFKCIEGWTEDMDYSGTKFSDFMESYKLGKKTDGKYFEYVGLETPDGEYYVSIDMESMLHEQTLLTYEMNGRPLTLGHGAPLRLLIPIKYGIKSLKRIGKIIFSDKRPPDYWAERGYDWYSGL
jgi:DMSO/TMAO reductase YedYZ molybdopterin-dependent catalytic subunit